MTKSFIENLDVMGSGDVCKELDNITNKRLQVLVKKYQIPHKMISCGMVFLKQDIIAFQEARKDKLKHRRK